MIAFECFLLMHCVQWTSSCAVYVCNVNDCWRGHSITIAGDDVTPDVLQQIIDNQDFPHPQVASVSMYTMSIAPSSIFGSVERLTDDAIFEM
jgi:hypothetical protein